ncbi:MAG: hypothetical protein ACREV3_13270 [Gammaproteobacteria bacterium]
MEILQSSSRGWPRGGVWQGWWIFVFVVFTAQVAAAPGDLDPTFGDRGKVTTDFAFIDLARDVALQPSDYKIVVVGRTDSNFALARYHSDGSLDTSFGKGGKVVTDFFGDDDGQGIVVQPDGKIVVVGEVFAGATSADFGLARYNSDGSLDTSFGDGGKVITDFGGFDLASTVALQRDGKIVVVGEAGPDFGVARYRSDGRLDQSFGDSGKLVTDFGGGNEVARAVSIQPNGKILAAGSGGDGNGNLNFVLARYRNNGTLDATFGKGGKVSTDFFGRIDAATSIAIQRNGRIVAAGSVMQRGDSNEDFGLVHYRRNGRVDSSFGDAGKVTTDFFGGSNDLAEDIAAMENCDILLAGFVVNRLATDFALALYGRDGTLDTKFGSGGKVTTDFGAQDQAAAVVLQPDGKIVVVGFRGDSNTGTDFALARYLSK